VRLRRHEDGFTLIELLTVLVLIAILVSIAVASFLGFRQRAQDRASQAVLREAMPAVHAYAGDHDGGFTGMTEAVLKAQYDAGLTGFVVVSADDESYCLRSDLNPRTWYGAGPPLTISQSTC
jgi:prepilin-type N-terminal cleavage/methylation domain-containing protein